MSHILFFRSACVCESFRVFVCGFFLFSQLMNAQPPVSADKAPHACACELLRIRLRCRRFTTQSRLLPLENSCAAVFSGPGLMFTCLYVDIFWRALVEI